MNDQILYGAEAIPAIMGLVQVLKQMGIPASAAPLAAVAFGVIVELGQVYAHSYAWIPSVFTGVSLGLAASGLYSGAKTIAPAIQARVGVNSLQSPPDKPVAPVSFNVAPPTSPPETPNAVNRQ